MGMKAHLLGWTNLLAGSGSVSLCVQPGQTALKMNVSTARLYRFVLDPRSIFWEGATPGHLQGTS